MMVPIKLNVATAAWLNLEVPLPPTAEVLLER